MRRAAELLLLVGGVLVSVYGLLAILYEGDAGGADPTVSMGHRAIDADLVGAFARRAADRGSGVVAPSSHSKLT